MISIIIDAPDPSGHERMVEMFRNLGKGIPHEVIGIDPGGKPATEFNRAAAASRYDRLLFCRDGVEILNEDFFERVIPRLDQFDVLGAVGTNRLSGPLWIGSPVPFVFGQNLIKREYYTLYVYNAAYRVFPGMEALDGRLLAVNRRVVEHVPFDDRTFNGRHFFDIDFTFSARLAGRRLAACADWATLSRPTYDMDDPEIREMADRFNRKNLPWLHSPPAGETHYAGIVLDNLDQAKVIMNPEHWKQQPDVFSPDEEWHS
jgi:hypothetical protein